MKKVITLILLVAVLSIGAYAQGEIIGALTYQISIPTGDTQDFVSRTNWFGLGLEGRKFVKPYLSVGLSIAWNSFREDVDIEVLGETIIEQRTIRSYPILFNTHVYFGNREKTMGYFGLGAGVYYIRNEIEIGSTKAVDSNWHFGLVPELGFLIKTATEVAFLGSVKYNYAFKAGDYTHSYWTVCLGIAWIG